MAARFNSTPRRKRLPIDLPRAFRGRLKPFSQATDVLWRRYLAGDDPAAFEALVAHYLPLVSIVAWRLKRARPKFYFEDIDILISDGCVGLLWAIQHSTGACPIAFARWAQGKIHRQIHREVVRRNWPSHHAYRAQCVIDQTRRRFVREHGQLPDRDELFAALAGQLNNPEIFLEKPRTRRFSDAPRARHSAGQIPDPNCPPADQELLDTETLHLALADLSPDDRRIAQQALEGVRPAAIARELAIHPSTASDRINGVLWTLRCRADLARQLGVEPVSAKPRHADHGGHLPSIKTAGPARLVG